MHCPSCLKLGLKVMAKTSHDHGSMYQRAVLSEAHIIGHETRFSIRWVSKGEYMYETAERQYNLKPGQFLILNHQQQYNAFLQSKIAETVSHTISFDLLSLSRVWYNINEKETVLADNPEPSSIIWPLFFENCFRMNSQMKELTCSFENIDRFLPNQDETFLLMLGQLLVQQRQHEGRQQSIPSAKKATRHELYRRLWVAFEALHDAPENFLSIEVLSQLACMSPFHFLRSFKSAFGISPHQLQTRLKIEKAMAMMCNKKEPLVEIALQVGFEDLSSFSHAFKRVTGIAPSLFLKT